jgi:hypothetical protein
MFPTEKSSVQRIMSDPFSVQYSCGQCVVQRKLVYCTVDLCSAQPYVESCGVEMCPSSTQATHPPPRPLTPLQPSNYRFSLLAELQRDGPGWCTPRKFTRSQSRSQRKRNSVRKFTIYFPTSNLVEHS